MKRSPESLPQAAMAHGPLPEADRPTLLLSLLGLGGLAIALYALFLPVQSNDIIEYYAPWYDQVRQRGLGALSGEFANYTPPYIYLLYLTSVLPFDLPAPVAIKLVSIVATVAAAAILAALVRDLTGHRSLALLAGFAFPLLPTVAANAGWWGQCDILYTAFVLASFRATLWHRPALAMLLFGVAVSFKLQAMFFAPYLALLVLRREIALRHCLIPPLAYAALMVPAWLAGRPALELATIYLAQAGWAPDLATGAPNPWTVLQKLPFISASPGMVLAGLLVTTAAFLALLARTAPDFDGAPRTRVVMAALCVTLAPFLLPKMHDRYFFMADVVSLLLLLLPGRLRCVPLLLQAASLSVYTATLTQGLDFMLRAQGILFASLAVGLLLHEVLRRRAPQPAAGEAGLGGAAAGVQPPVGPSAVVVSPSGPQRWPRRPSASARGAAAPRLETLPDRG